ncbi:hypothetical protein OHA70_33235 [Kribbella sp. NBC_00382]|uniref:hypothetical protein n=1 Tax=Kribbella sp. NBC_00382 TaxID=2975967 RepID=UPI002E22BE72
MKADNWRDIAVGAGLLIALASAIFTYLTIPPKRRLSISVTEIPIFSRSPAAPDIGNRVTIQHAEFGALVDPRIVLVGIRNTGRADIASSQFDQNQPLRVDLGLRILELLEVGSSLPAQIAPAADFDESSLLIKPGLISRKQQITCPCLIDGPVDLSIKHAFVGVKLDLAPAGSTELPETIMKLSLTRLMIGVALLFIIDSLAPAPTWLVASVALMAYTGTNSVLRALELKALRRKVGL